MANRNDVFETLDTMRGCGMSDRQILEELLGNTLSTTEAIDNLEFICRMWDIRVGVGK
jgi:hypothetical protein|tara:strand:+ start:1844 stop:2017 length:174 start_codon:yes stop_codon:yes gene_type:complete